MELKWSYVWFAFDLGRGNQALAYSQKENKNNIRTRVSNTSPVQRYSLLRLKERPIPTMS